MGADVPGGSRSRRRLWRAVGRPLLIAVLAAILLVPAWFLAQEFENPGNDLRAGIREAFADAYGRNRDQTVELDGIVDEDWDQLYVFAPLTRRERIDRTLAPADLDDDRDLVPADKTLVVLIRGDDVVEAATVARTPIDISCMTGGEQHALTPGDKPAVVRTTVQGRPRLAASEAGEAAARRCLTRLPAVPAS